MSKLTPAGRAKQDRFRGLPVPEGLSHHQRSWAARMYGCDCKLCLPSGRRNGEGRSSTERLRKLRADKKHQPVPAGTKHGVYTYKTYRCRCDACKAAYAANRARRKAAKLGNRGVWTITPRTTIVHWKPSTAGPDWVCPVCKEPA